MTQLVDYQGLGEIPETSGSLMFWIMFLGWNQGYFCARIVSEVTRLVWRTNGDLRRRAAR